MSGPLDPLRTPQRLYARVWRWHFFAALIVIPFVLWQSITGVLYLWSAQDIVLVSAETAVANAVSLHESSIKDGMVRMRPLSEGLRIPAGRHASLEAGHSHLMLEGLRRPLVPGDLIPVTLHFTSIGKIETTFAVKSLAELEGHGHDH